MLAATSRLATAPRAAHAGLVAIAAVAIACSAPAPLGPSARAASAARGSPIPPTTASASTPTTASARVTAESPAVPPVDALPSEVSDEPTGPRRIRVVLAPDQPPCELEFDAGIVDESEVDFAVGGITRIATIEVGSCSEGVLYDLDAERARAPDDELDAMMGGRLRKPGAELVEGWEGDDSCRLEDLDFDGWADLCLVEVFGSYSYSQRCWLFDPSTRTFRRAPELEPLTFATIDRAHRRLESARRMTGAVYEWQRHVWEQGKLVLDADEITYVGETPRGTPLKAPATEWVRRRERKRGKLVVVREGPQSPKPDTRSER
jgi:hypothetical protein